MGGDLKKIACPVGNSFSPDTRVLMADGATKPISKIRVGDEVRATDPETGKTSIQKVTQLHLNTDTELVGLTVHTADGRTVVVHHAGAPVLGLTQSSLGRGGQPAPGRTPELREARRIGRGGVRPSLHRRPGDVQPHSRQRAHVQGHVRTVGSEAELRGYFEHWTQGAKQMPARGPKIPDVYQTEDGTVIQWRAQLLLHHDVGERHGRVQVLGREGCIGSGVPGRRLEVVPGVTPGSRPRRCARCRGRPVRGRRDGETGSGRLGGLPPLAHDDAELVGA